jgi:hypothetical protein
MNNDPDFDAVGLDFTYNIGSDDSLGKDAWTPENYSTRDGFWDYEYDIYRYAGVYRQETYLIRDDWTIRTKIDFNSAYQGSVYSGAGGIRIAVYNENYEMMFYALVADGSASTNSHRIYGRFAYYDQDKVQHQVMTTVKQGDVDINDDYLGIKTNASGDMYVYYPDKILDGNGWRNVASKDDALSIGGTPTYISIIWHKWYEAPIDLHVTELQFYSGPSTGPFLSIDSPLNTTYTTNSIDFNFSGTADNYWYYIQGVDAVNLTWIDSINRILSDGTYTVHIYGNDSENLISKDSVTFTIDTIPPIVIIDSPSSEIYTSSDILLSLSGDADQYWYWIEEVDISNNTWTSIAQRSLDDGTYTLHAYGNDSAGNIGSATFTFTIDTTPSHIEILSPLAGISSNTDVIIELNGTADHYWYSIEEIDSNNITWTETVVRILSEGVYTIYAYGNDSAGNIAVVVLSFSIDITPPIVNIVSPEAGSSTANTNVSIDLDGTANSYWYMIEGVDTTNISWNGLVHRTIQEGTYTINAYGSDLAGNIARETLTFTVDTTPPIVQILYPKDGIYAKSSFFIDLNGTADYYWYNIVGIDAENVSWTSVIQRNLPDGTYAIFAYGNDSVGNIGIESVVITIDTSPPLIQLISPQPQIYSSSEISIDIIGTADFYWYRIESVDINNHSWVESTQRTLPEGVYTIHVYGSDSVGNVAYIFLTFIIESPTSTSTTTTSTTTETSTDTTVPSPSPGFEILLALLTLISILFVKHRRK